MSPLFRIQCDEEEVEKDCLIVAMKRGHVEKMKVAKSKSSLLHHEGLGRVP